MIVLNKDGVAPASVHPFIEMFRKEIDAYCAYHKWAEEVKDKTLQMALEEIMYDEYLHARFLRDYMTHKDMYSVDTDDEYERKFLKIQKDLFD